MRFDEETVGTYGDGGFGDGFNQFGETAADACRLVGLLQGVGGIHDNRIAELLHLRNAAEINDQVRIAESCSPLGQHDVVVSRIRHLLRSKPHGGGRDELPFLDVHNLARAGGSKQQISLTAEESGYLQYVRVFGSHSGFGGFVYVGDNGDAECFARFAEYFQCLLIAYAGERVRAGAIRLAVRAFEHVRDGEFLRHAQNLFGNMESHLFPLNHAGAGYEEKVPAAFEIIYTHSIICLFYFRCSAILPPVQSSPTGEAPHLSNG
ncbi:hypothetical protein Barb7_03057 [Bacteroidales bacterium Barb7]|nr:hypothetical protein Barb7_03057 [Bacteroidales bacterium Barb7]